MYAPYWANFGAVDANSGQIDQPEWSVQVSRVANLVVEAMRQTGKMDFRKGDSVQLPGAAHSA